MNNPSLYGIDIETDTHVSETERANGILVKGLDPTYSAVTDIVVAGDAWEKVFSGPESEILPAFNLFLKGLVPGMLVSWNGSVFDFPFLDTRYQMLGLSAGMHLEYDPEFPVKYEPTPGYLGGYQVTWGEHSHVDISPLYKQTAQRLAVKHSLKPVVSAVTGVNPIEVDRAHMELLSDADRIAYVASDGRITRELALRLPVELLVKSSKILVSA